MIAEFEQVGLVELKRGRKLPRYLVHAVEPLQEYGAAFVDVRVIGDMNVALSKFVAEHEPIYFD